MEPPEKRVVALLHIVDHVAGNVDAGDFVLVHAGELYDSLLGEEVGYGKRGVDENAVSLGHAVHHHLKPVGICKGLTAGENEIAFGGDLVEHADALAYLFYAEAFPVAVFLLVDTERAVVVAVVGHEHRNGGAALSGHVFLRHGTPSLEYCANYIIKGEINPYLFMNYFRFPIRAVPGIYKNPIAALSIFCARIPMLFGCHLLL